MRLFPPSSPQGEHETLLLLPCEKEVPSSYPLYSDGRLSQRLVKKSCAQGQDHPQNSPDAAHEIPNVHIGKTPTKTVPERLCRSSFLFLLVHVLCANWRR